MRVDRKLPLPWGQACGASEEGKRKHAACRDPGVSITDRKQTRARGVQQRYLAASAGSRSGPPAGRKLFGRLRKLRRRAFRQEEIFLWVSGERAAVGFSPRFAQSELKLAPGTLSRKPRKPLPHGRGSERLIVRTRPCTEPRP